MAPILHCIRHAQGYHNLTRDDMDCEQIHDPDLTKRGREQCERLQQDFPFHDQVDFIMASPIRRTIQTALIGLAPAIDKRGLKVLLVPRAQETSCKPSDTGSSVSKLKEEFGEKIILDLMTDGWNSNNGEWAMDVDHIEAHVRQLRHYIHDLNCKEAVLVAHGGFMHYFTEDWSDCPGDENETGWYNTEWRTYKFLNGAGAHLQETADSRERRANKITGGFRVQNGAPDHE